MHKILSLAKVIIKNNGNTWNLRSKSNKNSNAIKITLGVAFIFLMISFFMSFYSSFILANIDENGNIVATDIDYINKLLIIFIPYVFLFIFVFLNTLIISTFFLSTDSECFLHLPIKPYEVFLAKLINILVYSYIIELIFLLPLNISYILTTSFNIFSTINQILYFISFPFIPISLVFILSFIITKIINFKKRKNIAIIVLSVVSIISLLFIQSGFNSFFASDIENINGDNLLAFKDLVNSSASNIKIIKPVLEYIALGYTKNTFASLLHGLSFFFISSLFIIICSFIANKFYQKHLLDETQIHNRKVKKDLEIKITSPRKSYALKEWRMIYRSPNLLIQTIFPPLIIIAVLGVTFYTLYQDQSTAAEFDKWYLIIKDIFYSYPSSTTFASVALAFLTSSTIMISSSSFSREGKNIAFLKNIPLDPLTQIRIKMIPGTIITFIIDLFVIIATAFIFKLTFPIVLIALIICLLSIIICNYMMVILDLKNPFLDWSNETAAIKQNKVVLLSTLILFGLTALSIGLIFLVIITNISYILTTIILILILFILISGFEIYLHKKRHSIFEHLE